MPHHRPVDAMAYPRFEGIRTFMRLPHLAEVDRLAEADLAIVGVPFDTGATYRVGARFGPSGIRQESMLLRPYHPELAVDVLVEVMPAYDVGALTQLLAASLAYEMIALAAVAKRGPA